MKLIKRLWLKSRWIGNPPLGSGELMRQSSQIKDGLAMGMRLAVLEDQAAAVVAEGRLSAVFLPGAYQLEQDKMPPLKPHPKLKWLYPAQLYFLNMSPTPAKPWQPAEPLLTRDPERGLVQLLLAGEYVAQVKNAALFMQNMILERDFADWSALHDFLSSRLNDLSISLMAQNRMAVARLEKMREKTALALQTKLNQELRGSGLALLEMHIYTLEVHPQMRRLWQEQKDYASFNHVLAKEIVS
ncbi:MAG: SPFH domain-containing protein [Clostridiales bacterium]|nr:SPFH domain-containing protein [Clostridiales bacterium]